MPTLRERYPYTRDPSIFPPIKPEHAQAIGYVAAHWSLIEEQLGAIVVFLLSMPTPVAAALLAEVSILTRTAMIRALLQISQEAELVAEWKALEGEIDVLRSKRNDAVHAVWVVSEPGHYAKRIKAKSKFRYEFGPVDTATLTTLSADILELADKLVSFTSGVIFSGASKCLTDHFLLIERHVPALAQSVPVLAQAPNRGPRKRRPRKPSRAARRKAAFRPPSESS